MADEEFAGPTTCAWVTNSALIAVLREEGVLSDVGFTKLLSRIRKAADAYQAAGHPADARDLRRDADLLEAGTHVTASPSD